MRHRLTLNSEDVHQIMNACKREAGRRGWCATIAIVDDSGALWMLERLDGAGPISADVAIRKARTSAVTQRATKFWEDRAKDRPGFLTHSADIMLQGGLPMIHRGDCLGGIGVSGVQSAEDEQIAQAGIFAFDKLVQDTV